MFLFVCTLPGDEDEMWQHSVLKFFQLLIGVLLASSFAGTEWIMH